jgi:hypothetical protein
MARYKIRAPPYGEREKYFNYFPRNFFSYPNSKTFCVFCETGLKYFIPVLSVIFCIRAQVVLDPYPGPDPARKRGQVFFLPFYNLLHEYIFLYCIVNIFY